ncbi:MAG: hypothetical protein WCE30_13525 [Mycobacterium sp.]
MTTAHLWHRPVTVIAVGAALLTACQRPPAPGPQAGAGAGGAMLNNVPANQVVQAMSAAGLAVGNPHDVTAQKCPDIKCIEQIDTDALSVIRFSTTGAAEAYAGASTGTYQAENFVLQFGPSVSVDGRGAYEKVVTQQLH